MARLSIGLVVGIAIGVIAGAALGISAQSESGDPPAPLPAATVVTAIRVGIDPLALHGAVLSTGASDAVAYLQHEGMLERPPPPSHPPELTPTPTVRTSLVDCIIWRESRGNPRAVNPRSGASGLGQFLASTWRTTPQGRAGYSVFDPVANRAAVAWMISVGRGREFVTIGGC